MTPMVIEEKPNVIGAIQLRQLTGATYRQVDYWTRERVIPVLGDATPGSGTAREYDIFIVPRVTLLAKISNAFLKHLSPGILKAIFENYEAGYYDLSPGVRLSWEK